MLKRVIKNQQGKSHRTSIVVKGDSSQSLHIRGCDTVTIKNAIVENWKANGDIVSGKPPAIQLTDCHNLIIESPIIKGNPDESSKSTWRHSVCNGIRVDASCTNIQIIEPHIERVHFGMDIRGEAVVKGGKIRFISGDHVLARGDNFTLEEVELLDSLFVLPYSLIHRDYVQLIKLAHKSGDFAFIENVLIQGCIMRTDSKSHPWATDPDQPVTLTDGHGRNVSVVGNHITTEKDIAILMNPCDGLTIKSNVITSTRRPSISCEDRKKTGCVPSDISIYDNHYQKPLSTTNRSTFKGLCESLKNHNPEKLTEADYLSAAKSSFISVPMIKAVAAVESRGDGFQSGGNIKVLLERHWVFKLAKRNQCLEPILKSAGYDNCSIKPGGYLGGEREYPRIQSVADADCNESLTIALMSISMGMWQIMGFNYSAAGYDSPIEMFEDFHRNEGAQLRAFVKFIQSKNLIGHLQDAEEAVEQGKNPLKALDKFARGYNGKNHKNYHLKISKAYRMELERESLRQPEAEVEIKPAIKDGVIQGGSGATIANGVAGVALAKELLDGLEDAKKVTEQLKDQVNEIATQSSSSDMWLWIALAFVILNQLGVIRAIWSAVTDRRLGKSL